MRNIWNNTVSSVGIMYSVEYCMGCPEEIWQEGVRGEKQYVCALGGGGGGVQEEVGAGYEILDLRTAAVQGQKGSRPYLGVASSQPIITD